MSNSPNKTKLIPTQQVIVFYGIECAQIVTIVSHAILEL